jgi:hypothetical protein
METAFENGGKSSERPLGREPSCTPVGQRPEAMDIGVRVEGEAARHYRGDSAQASSLASSASISSRLS